MPKFAFAERSIILAVYEIEAPTVMAAMEIFDRGGLEPSVEETREQHLIQILGPTGRRIPIPSGFVVATPVSGAYR